MNIESFRARPRSLQALHMFSRVLVASMAAWSASLLLIAQAPAYEPSPTALSPASEASLNAIHISLSSETEPLVAGSAGEVVVEVFDEDRIRYVESATIFLTLLSHADELQGEGRRPHGHSMAPAMRDPGSASPPGSLGRIETRRGEVAAERTQQPGRFAASVQPHAAGPQLLRVRITALDGHALAAPLIAELSIIVGPPLARSTGLLITSIIALLAFVGTMAWGIRHLLVHSANLLEIGWLRRLMTSRYYQPALQIPTLMIFGFVLAIGWFDDQGPGRNLATTMIWTIWWAGIIFTIIFLGRLWCVACPIGAISGWCSKLTKPARRLPRRLRNLWLASVAFLVITALDGVLGIVASAPLTVMLFLIILGVAVLIGFLYQRRTFCRYLCPIGGLVGIYSMVAPVELRVKEPPVCASEKVKDCYVGNEHGTGCPMFEFPQTMTRNNYCSFCGECLKTCAKQNIVLRLRPFGRDLWTARTWRLDEAAFAVALFATALVATGHMVAPWHAWMDALSSLLPFEALGITSHERIEQIMFVFVLIGAAVVAGPALFIASAALSRRLSRAPEQLSIRETLTRFGYAFIPLALAVHLAHNLQHLIMEGPRVVPMLQATINAYAPLLTSTPHWQIGALLNPLTVYFLQLLILFSFFGYSCYTAYRIARHSYATTRQSVRALLPQVSLALFFFLVSLFLLSQEMSARHHG